MHSRRSSASLCLVFVGSVFAALAPALGCSRAAGGGDESADTEGALGAAAACHDVAPVTTSGLSPALASALGGAKRADCMVQTDRGPKAMHVLTLRGAFPQITRAHGFLLGQQVADGSFADTLRLMEKEIGEGGPKAKLVYDC